MEKRNLRKTRTGIVVSDKADKTISVIVERRLRHVKYGKFVNKSKKYMAHDDENNANIGDTVQITETRPLSKNKTWRLEKIIERAK